MAKATLKTLIGYAGIHVDDADFVLPHGAGCRCAPKAASTPATNRHGVPEPPSVHAAISAYRTGTPPAKPPAPQPRSLAVPAPPSMAEVLKQHQERLQALRGPGRPSSNDREANQRARLLEEGLRKVRERSDRQWPD